MASPTVQSALNDLIAAIKAEVRTEFMNTLAGTVVIVKSKGGSKMRAPSRARPKGGKRTPEELEALVSSVLSFIKKNPASRVEHIATGLGTTTKELALPIGKLWNAGSLKVEGQRRGMKYTAK